MNHLLIWLVIALVVICASALWIRQRLKLRRAHTWPVCRGTVASTAVRLEGVGTEQRYIAEMSYSYTVKGIRHFGRLRRSFMLHGRAHAWVGDYPTGRSLLVHSNPVDEGDSVLFEDEQSRAGAA